jgi:ABC-type antimicrobial peptide transport system permease subunit
LGVYGLPHHLVAQRTNEIGVRVAPGEQPLGVMALVLRQGLTIAVVGIAAGLIGAVLV